MNTLKEKIAKAITEHVNLEDTYTYKLTRVKSAFFVGTVDLGDFEEWSETDVDELTEAIVNALQLQLNENQQIVLEWLKADYIDDDESNPISSIWSLHADHASDESLGVATAYIKLTDKEEAQVLQLFSQWVLEQEGQS